MPVAFIALVVVASGLARAQPPSTGSTVALAYESGNLASNVYSNECFGFSLAIAEGWLLSGEFAGGDVSARHTSADRLVLLSLRQETEGGGPKSAVLLRAFPAIPSARTAQEFVSHRVHPESESVSAERRTLIRDTYAVQYGGRRFSRVDYKASPKGADVNISLYQALVYTKFRGYFIGGDVSGRSLEDLDRSANMLANLRFRDDERNPKCGMNGKAGYADAVGGSPGFAPGASPSSPEFPMRVRVASEVSTGLLISKVPPQYPDHAKRARIQGQVVLQAWIGRNGDVEQLSIVSGHPLLAPAAIAAVGQWKYMPYLLNGEAVRIETQIVVNFRLPGS